MAGRNVKTTFERGDVIEPFYTGGPISTDAHGRILATCLVDAVVLSSLQNGRGLARLEGDGESVTSLSLTPSASHLVICSRSLSMRIYSLDISDTGREVTTSHLRTIKAHTVPVVVSTIDESGTMLATGCSDGTLKVWNIIGGYISHTFKAHAGVISSLKFYRALVASSDRPTKSKNDPEAPYRLASGGEDGRLRVFDLTKRKALINLEAHSSAITSIDYSRGKKVLATGSRDKTLATWNANTWKPQKVLPVLESIESVGFTAGGRLIYCGGENGNFRLWNIDEAHELTPESSKSADQSAYTAIIPQAKVGTVLCVRDNFMLEIRELGDIYDHSPQQIPDAEIVRQISGTHDEVIDLAFVTPKKEFMALATNTESVKIVSVKSTIHSEEEAAPFGADVALLEGHDDIILSLDADRTGRWLATGAKDYKARLWKYDDENGTFTCTTVFSGHAGSIGALALSHTRQDKTGTRHNDEQPPQFLVTGSQDKTVKLWDIRIEDDVSGPNAQSRATQTRKAHDKDINAIALDPDCNYFASASQDRLVKIWSVEECEVQGVLRGHKRGVWSVSFAPKDMPAISGESGPQSSKRGFILTGSGDRTVKIWSLFDYSCLKSFEGHVNSILKVLWIPPPEPGQASASSKRPYLAASAAGDGLVKVWDTDSGECICTLDNHTERVWALAFDPLTQRLVSGGGDGVITFWTDTTETTMATAVAESTVRVEQEQMLMNHLHRGNYKDAIVLALQLNHPARLLSLFSNVMKTSPPEPGSLCGVKAVDEAIAGLNDEQLFTLVLRIRDWNANARTAPVAQKILWVIFKTFPATKLVDLKKNGKGLGEVLEGLRAYTERHFRRMDELLEESYLVDFVVRSMEESGFVNGVGLATKGINHDSGADTIMVE